MEKSLKNRLISLILVFAAGIIPLVVKLNIVAVNHEEFSLIRNNKQIADVFSYSKSHLIIICTVLISTIYLIYFFTSSEKIDFLYVKKPIFFLPVSFLFFVLLSSLFSNYPATSLYGISERYEGLFVIFGYIIFFAATINCVKNEQSIKFILYAILFSASFILLIGLSQFLGSDFLISKLGKKILLIGYTKKEINIKPVFNNSYSTLYNPNCLGLYCTMIFPIIISSIFFFKENYITKYLCLALSMLSIINLFASNSTGGLIGTFASVFFMAITIIIYLINNNDKKYIFYLLGVISILSVILFFSPAKNNITKMMSKFTSSAYENFFTDLRMTNNSAQIFYSSGNILMEYKDSKINLYEDGKLIEPKKTKNNNQIIYNYNSEKLTHLQILFDSKKIIALRIKNISLIFGLHKNNLLLLSNKGKIIDINSSIQHFGFDGYEFMASSRGYIWSRSLPLIKKNIFIGGGPDTFVFSFPQNDVAGKLKFHSSPYIIVDKPHNFYLQTIINTGLFSLLFLLALFIYYFFMFIKSLLGKNKFSIIQIGFASGIFGYLISCLATDSTVSVSPLFWITLGVGFSLIFFEESV